MLGKREVRQRRRGRWVGGVCVQGVEGRGGNSSGSNSGGGNSSGGGWQRMNGMNQVDKEGAMAAGVEVLGKREVWRRRRGR